MAAKTKAIQVLEKIIGALIALGALLVIGGAGLFIYVIFYLEGSRTEEGGTLIAEVVMPDDQHVAVLNIPALDKKTLVQPRLKFTIHTSYELERTREYSYGRVKSLEPAFRQWVKLTLSDETGLVLKNWTALLNWDTASDPEIPRYGDPPNENLEGRRMGDAPRTFEYRPPIPLPAGRKAVLRLEFLQLPAGDESKPMEDPATSLGSVSDVQLSLYKDVFDILAHSNFKAEAPTWGLYGGLTGLALVIFGLIALAKMPVPPAPPKT